jgi:hypothetical protein
MSMANLVTFMERGDGAGQLVRLACKVDAEAEGTLLWDCDFAFPIGNDEVADLDAAIPAAKAHRTRATDGQGSTVVKFRPVVDGVRLSITNTDGDTVLDGVSAKIRHLEMRTTEKVQVYVARLRVQAVPAALAGALCACLGKRVGLVADPVQQSLFENGGKTPLPPIGSVVCAKALGDADVYGIFRGEKGESLVVDDFGAVHPATRIISSMQVSNAEGDTVARYVRDCRTNGTSPSWKALVLALGQAIGASTAQGSEAQGWTITDAVTADALGLPAEAGEKPVTKRRAKAN